MSSLWLKTLNLNEVTDCICAYTIELHVKLNVCNRNIAKFILCHSQNQRILVDLLTLHLHFYIIMLIKNSIFSFQTIQRLKELPFFLYKMASFLSLNSEDLLSLPIEVWIQIWSLLDFDTLQKKCTRVSKKWFQEIRDSPSLSGEMKLTTTLNEDTASWAGDAVRKWWKSKTLFVIWLFGYLLRSGLNLACPNWLSRDFLLSETETCWEPFEDFFENKKVKIGQTSPSGLSS